jgi:hypothetical protein
LVPVILPNLENGVAGDIDPFVGNAFAEEFGAAPFGMRQIEEYERKTD